MRVCGGRWASRGWSVLPGDVNEGRRCLLQMQVTGRSALGALALHTGGLLVDNGWLARP
ncbi:DUF2625 family protein [Streptomyces sp. NPDC056240]|uniref:DUF2625 family protein n=1 Tax=Streptomyces sp. NPDC056240 TaxID=3345759 RepID=UPI0035D77F22